MTWSMNLEQVLRLQFAQPPESMVAIISALNKYVIIIIMLIKCYHTLPTSEDLGLSNLDGF